MKKSVVIGGAIVVGLGLIAALGPFGVRNQQQNVVGESNDVGSSEIAEMVTVSMPVLDGNEALGAQAFQAKCAACHGANAGGVDGSGPPLIHKIYEPSHHGDFAFFRAAELGVRSHHWQFGDMPPVDGITRAEIASIIAFLRRVQRENGIS